MARHVGRPTNEEVAARKRKQMLKILIPGGLVALAVVMIIGSTGLRGLMGASIGDCSYKCEEGWTPGENNVCYLESEDITKNLSSYVLGDTNNDGVMNAQDYDQINSDITNGVELDNIKQAIYDINQDGEINTDDLTAFNDAISSTSTVGTVSSQILVCPTEIITTEQDEEGNEITVTTNYELNNNQCIAKIRREKQAKKVCQGVESTGDYDDEDNFVDEEENEQSTDEDNISNELESDPSTKTDLGNGDQLMESVDGCQKDSEGNEYCTSDSVVNTNGDIISGELDEFSDDDEDNFVESNDVAYKSTINKTTNYLKYADNNTQTQKKYVYIMTKNGNTNEWIQDAVRYAIYESKTKCEQNLPLHSLSVAKTNYITHKVFVRANATLKMINYKISTKLQIPNSSEYYIKQTSLPGGKEGIYNERQTKCVKIDPEWIQTGEKEITRRVVLANTVKTNNEKYKTKYKIIIDNRAVSTLKPVAITSTYGVATSIENYLNPTGKTFIGWTAVRKSDGKTLCYIDKNRKKYGWEKSCTYGRYYLGKNGKTKITSLISKNGDILTLTSRWKYNKSVKILNTSKNALYKGTIGVSIYNTAADCKANKNSRTTITTKSGVVGINNILNTSRSTYYARVTKISDNYYSPTTCYALNINNNVTIKVKQKSKSKLTYTIKYNLNGGKNNASNPAKYNVTTNTITLKNPTRSGYTFKGWYSDSKYKTKVTQIKKGSTGNKTLYAKWSKKTYTIKYNLNGGKNNASNPAKYNVTTNTITLKNPTRSGYTFKGWYSDSKYKTKVTQIKKGSTGNKTLYAKWSKKITSKNTTSSDSGAEITGMVID